MAGDTKQMWMAQKVVLTPLTELKPYAHNNRSHSAASIGKWSAPIGWSSLNVSAWLAFGLLAYCFLVPVEGNLRRYVA
jgi:hypothetical protein